MSAREVSHFSSLLEPHTRHTVDLVTLKGGNATLASFCPTGTHPIQVFLLVPEVAPPGAWQLVYWFPPTAERFKPSRAFQIQQRPQGSGDRRGGSGDLRTTARRRLVLPVPARGPRGPRRPGRSLCGQKRSPIRSLAGSTAFVGPETLSDFCLTVTGSEE